MKTTCIVATAFAIPLIICIVIAQNTRASAGYTSNGDIDIIAHRGGAGEGIENSLSCIEKSIAAGADIIEIDIRLTKDDEIVVCHDSDIRRTTNGKGKIEEMTLGEVQSALLLARDGTPTDECIPTLGEVLDIATGRCRLLIEVKPCKRYERISQLLVEAIEERDAAEWVAVQSFSDNALFALKAMNAPFPIEKLIVLKIPLLPIIIDNGISAFNYRKYDFVSSFNINYKGVQPSFIDDAHSQGKEVKIWTAKRPADTPALDADGIITDYPTAWRSK